MINSIINFLKKEDKYILFVYFYLFIVPWNFFKWQMGVLTVILFVWWLIRFRTDFIENIKLIFQFKPLFILIIFIVYVYITPFWSESWKIGILYVNDFYKYYILLVPVLFTSLNKEEAKKGLILITLSFISYSIFSILIYLGLFTISHTNSDELNPKGIMGYAIVTIYMGAGAISSFILAFFSKNNRIKIIFYIFSIICFFALFVNNSRTSQLSFALTIVTLIIINYRSNIFKLKNLILGILLITITLSASIYLVDKAGKLDRYITAFNEMKVAFLENKYEGSLGFRLYFNKIGIDMIKSDNFLFGMGPVDNTDELANILKNDPTWVGKPLFNKFHNTHLDLITKYGYLGYSLLLISIVYLFLSINNKDIYYLIGLSFFILIFYASLTNGTFEKKPINYILIIYFVLLSVISFYENHKEKYKIDN